MYATAILKSYPTIDAHGIPAALTSSPSICYNATATIFSFVTSTCCAKPSARCNRGIHLKFMAGWFSRNIYIAFYNFPKMMPTLPHDGDSLKWDFRKPYLKQNDYQKFARIAANGEFGSADIGNILFVTTRTLRRI